MNSNYEDKFDRWIRDNRPEVPDDEVNRKIHLAIFRERFRDKQQTGVKRLLLVPVLALIMMVGVGVIQLGGDSLEMTSYMSETYPELKLYRNEFRNTGIGGTAGLSEKVAMELSLQDEMDMGVPVKATGLMVGEAEYWTVTREFDVFGEKKTLSSAPSDFENNLSRKYLPFVMDHMEGITAAVENGTAQPTGTREVEFEGIRYLTYIYEFEYPEWGKVIFLDGDRIP